MIPGNVRLHLIFAFGCLASGLAADRVAPGSFLIDPPTLENLGFRWYIEGDANRNASVAV
ncbi:MAG: hypothetical protein GY953_28885, partial [bacterium]|nr:hypothetical protein [bacterium]